MAEPIGTTSGLLALAVFAFNSSVSLYQAVESFRSNQRTIRELKEELEALNGVLQPLQDEAANSNSSLEGLKLPLLCCGKACKDFEALIVRCTEHSDGSRTSFRDWAKLKYMGADIAGFKNMLAGYKSTISIALGDANLRTAAVTATAIKKYKEMLTNTTSDLEEHLQHIDNRLQELSLRGTSIKDEDVAEQQRAREEKESIEQCLAICARASEHAGQVRTNIFEDVSADQNARQVIVSTLGDLISAKRVSAGVGAIQCLGQMSDVSLQQQSRDRGIGLSGGTVVERTMGEQNRRVAKPEDQYGAGHKLD